MKENTAAIKIIDKSIFVFLFLFFASLMNSIFVNQIGYFGALIFLLVRFWITKENPFRKTGLELFFAIFLIAEILSTIFSVAPAQSFHNFLKRILLIPTFYVVFYAGSDEKRGVFFVKTFLVFSVLSSALYLWNSYSFYLRGLFQLNGSGPFLFHYPITTSELFSFTAILLLAFLFNKDLTRKEKLLTAFAFAITFLSLLATFKRTGWIGFMAGVLVIMIMKRKYFYLAFFFILVIAGIVLEKSKSEIIFLNNADGKLIKTATLPVKDQALSLKNDNGELLVANYTEGLLATQGKNLEKRFWFETPIVVIKKWKEKYYTVELADRRFIALEKNKNDFKNIGEFFSAGYTKDFTAAKGNLYLLDSDSGLTIYTNPKNLLENKRIKELKNYLQLLPFKNFIGLFSKSEGVTIFRTDSAGIKRQNYFELKDAKPSFAAAFGDTLFVQIEDGFAFVDLNDSISALQYIESNRIKNEIRGSAVSNNKLYLLAVGGDIYSTVFPLERKMIFKKEYSLGFNPKAFVSFNDGLALTYVKRNRFMTTFDPYNQSNAVRISLWTAGVKMFLDHPLFGVGDIDLANLYRQYKKKKKKEIQGHLHNNYFHLLATLGAFGFIAAMFLFWKIFSLLLKAYKRSADFPYASSFTLSALAVFASFLTAGLFEWNFGDHEIITFIWFVTGMAAALGKISQKREN